MNKHLIALTYIEKLGPVTLKRLLELFDSPIAVWQATNTELQEKNVPQKIIDLLINERHKLDLNKICENIKQENIKVVSILDDDYPKLLKETHAPPLVLYYRGNLEIFKHRPALAVVGSRKISTYAKMIMPELLNEVAGRGILIVSGLAYGVDGLAHQITLNNDGLTVGVLGSGLLWENFHPKSNLKLAEKIIESNGLIISEFPPEITASIFTFPRRNRVISGLTQAVLIIEASQKSGALITAKYALEQNRDVLAVPQNINSPNSKGVNYLINNGAKTVTTSNDILDSLNIYPIHKNKQESFIFNEKNLNSDEKIICQILSAVPIHIDKITENCTLDTSVINSCLIQMELKGLVKNIGNQEYVRN